MFELILSKLNKSLLISAISLFVGFSVGWFIKDKIDDVAMLESLIAKQNQSIKNQQIIMEQLKQQDVIKDSNMTSLHSDIDKLRADNEIKTQQSKRWERAANSTNVINDLFLRLAWGSLADGSGSMPQLSESAAGAQQTLYRYNPSEVAAGIRNNDNACAIDRLRANTTLNLINQWTINFNQKVKIINDMRR